MKKRKNGEVAATNFFRRNLGYILLITGLVVITGTIVLAVLLTAETPPIEPPEQPTGNVPITYAAPVSGYTIGQEASLDMLVYSSTMKDWRTHNGIDFVVEKGTAVSAIQSGTVTSVVTNTLYGTTVTIEHADGVVSIYRGLTAEGAIEQGATVTKGQQIGFVGDEALFEVNSGVHLHLEMKVNGVYVDPAEYIEELQNK